MTIITDRTLEVISSSTPVGRATVEELLSPTQSQSRATALHDVLEGTRRSRPTVRSVRSESVTTQVAEVVSESGVQADLYLTEAADGTGLDGFRVVASPSGTTPASFREEIDRLGAVGSVYLRDQDHLEDDDRVVAVSSLVKIFVLLALVTEQRRGRLTWSDRLPVQEPDVHPRSAGLGRQHIGQSVPVADLTRLMMLRSDNTATDLLLRSIGDQALVDAQLAAGVPGGLARPLMATSATWAHEDQAHPVEDPGQVELPVRHAHHDYHYPLRTLVSAADLIGTTADEVWPGGDALGGQLRYKGGSAAGVLAGLWHLRRPGAVPAALAMSVNATRHLGVIEEVHLLTCADQVLQTMGKTRAGVPA